MINCAFWTVHLVGCNDVLIDGIRLLNNLQMANSGGIDPDHCNNVRIANCHIECGDEAIVLENSGDFRNILVENCTTSRSNRGISIQIRDGGNVENVVFSNITMETRRFFHEWWGRAEAICLTAYDRKPGVYADYARDLRFDRIKMGVADNIRGCYRQDVSLLKTENIKFL